MISRLSFILAIAATLCAVPARAEPLPFHRYLFQGWSTESGLPQISVNAMTRDDAGLLWAGTENGLARFDGSEFENYSEELRALSGTSWVTALQRDARDRIWVGTLRGVVIAERGVLHAVPVDGPLAPGKVSAIAEDPAGRVCVAAQQLWCTLGDRLVAVRDWEGEATALLGTADSLWIAGSGRLLRQARGRGTESLALPAALANARINALAHDGTRLWIGSTAGLWILGEVGVAVQAEVAATSDVRALAVDAQGTVWASTREELYRYSGRQLIERLDGRALRGLGNVISLLAETDGSLWLGSQTNGLLHVWHAGIEKLDRHDGLGNLSVWSYLADRGGLLAGTDDGVWELSGGRFSQHIPGSALPNAVGYCLLRDQAGRLYVGTRAGLARFAADGELEHAFPELARHQVNSLLEEPDGTVWAASHGGLIRIVGETVQRVGQAGELGEARVRGLLRDRDGVLWVGTETGLFRRDGEEFVRVAEPGPGNTFTMTLLELNDGRLLAGTYENGLFLKDLAGWRRLSREDGLPSDSVFFMAERDEALILSHPNGVYRLALPQLAPAAVRPLPVEILMQDVGRQAKRAWLRCCNGGGTGRGALHGGYAWLASLSGALRVSLDTAAPAPPQAQLRGARQGSQALDVNAGISLSGENRDLSLRYGAVDFRDAHRLRYRYRLDGFDADWVDAGRRREAFYTNLPAGEYRFLVQAHREYEAWGPVAEAVVRVPPVLVERWPFRFGVALVVLFSVALWLRWRETLSRREQARLEATVAQRTNELRLANERLASLNEALAAASVTDPLTGLHNRRFIHEQIGSVVANLRRNRARSGEDRVIGICVMDLDHFKRVNDDYGHAVGDRVLKRVAAALKREMRDGDYLLRWGGEEFVLITNESLRPALAPIVERLRAAVEASPAAPGEPQRITVSVGYAAYPLPGQELDTHDWLSAMNLADQALFGAKSAGRNRIATVDLTETAREELSEHLSAARLAELYASGQARLLVGL